MELILMLAFTMSWLMLGMSKVRGTLFRVTKVLNRRHGYRSLTFARLIRICLQIKKLWALDTVMGWAFAARTHSLISASATVDERGTVG